EVYSGEFVMEAGVVVPTRPERLGLPAEVPAPAGGGWCAVGNGFASHAEALAPLAGAAAAVCAGLVPAAVDLLPAAAAELAAGRTVPAEAALPVYLREHTAWRRRP